MNEATESNTHPVTFNTPALQRYRVWRYAKDQIATVAIGSGGIGVLLAILLIFVYLFYEVVPLFRGAEVSQGGAYDIAQIDPTNPSKANVYPAAVYLAIEEQNEIAMRLDESGELMFFRLKSGELVSRQNVLPSGRKLSAFTIQSEESRLMALALDDGSVRLVQHNYRISYPDGKKRVTPQIDFPYGDAPLVLVDPALGSDGLGSDSVLGGGAFTRLALSDTDDAMYVAGVDAGGKLGLWRFTKEEDMLTEETTLEKQQVSIQQPDRKVSGLEIDSSQRWLFVSTETKIHVYDLWANTAQAVLNSVLDLPSPVTTMQLLLGGNSLLTTHADGYINQWFMVRDAAGRFNLHQVRQFQVSDGIPAMLNTEQRRKGFLVLTTNGQLEIFHSTAERHVYSQQISANTVKPLKAALSPRSDSLLVELSDGQLAYWKIDNQHPDVSWSALWSQVWYEGYDKPDYIWQSSAANNDFEPKYSLVPLSFGTLKAAFYAMLVGAPLAIFGAIYTAYFMSPALRRKVKPLVELMEALPTVILGFLAGLWLAPFMESNLTAIFMLLLFMPPGILLVSYWYHKLPASLRHSVPEGWEGLILVPAVLLIGWICVSSNGYVEYWFFNGDMRAWITHELGISFDQRNALVVGVAMGFAVIPTIFSITEDAIFSVPKHLSNGSLALGATRWQTLVGVVLPTASPGMFSALMIGFGRAVGETMIVLMATGNTPIMDFNIFEGMRTLAANIAVEVPEAEVNSTHYHVLFLAAFVLFMFTFMVNTVAEIVRQRLRKKYGSL